MIYFVSLIIGCALVVPTLQQDQDQDDCLAAIQPPDACGTAVLLASIEDRDALRALCADAECVEALGESATTIQAVCENTNDSFAVTRNQAEVGYLAAVASCGTGAEGNLCLDAIEAAYEGTGKDPFATNANWLEEVDQSFWCEECGFAFLEVERARVSNVGDDDDDAKLAEVEAYIEDTCPDGAGSGPQTEGSGATMGMDAIMTVALLITAIY